MELGLVVEAHGRAHRVGQRDILVQGGGQARLLRGQRFVFGLARRGAGRYVRPGEPAPEVAVDLVLAHPTGDPLERGLVGLAVGAGAVGTELLPQVGVDHPVL